MAIKYNFLFNFAVSKTGGGLKRLYYYAKWFDHKGGAYFIINPKCKFFEKKFPNNKYFIVYQNRFERVIKDCEYLQELKRKIDKPDIYYSYGIPIYYKFGKINWFHLSNILSIHSSKIKLSIYDKYIRYTLLKWKIKSNFHNADIVSAESDYSLKLFKNKTIKEKFLSINGSDDEIEFLKKKINIIKKNLAIVVGTQSYKNIIDAYAVFENLKKNNKFLKLIVIGDKKQIPKKLMKNTNILFTGVVQQSEVIKLLKESKYYISTTSIENSFNAASEGVVFADESYLSDIDPHRELLKNENYELISMSNLPYKLIKVNRKLFKGKNILLWNDIIVEKINKIKSMISIDN